MPEVCLLNGRAVSPRSAMIPVDDWGMRYGWGLFETIRIHKGCPLFLERHLARLCGAASLLEVADDAEEQRTRWRLEIRKAVKLSSMNEGILNCYWTRGSLLAQVRPSRVIRVRPRSRYPKGPLKLWLAPWRIEPTYPGTGVKTLAYFPYIFAGLAARREGFDEALVLNTSNRVADGAASSIFLISDGQVLTPRLDQGTLPGITRSVVLDILRELKIPHRETRITWKSLLRADEVFVTSSLRGISCVSQISDHWRLTRRKAPNCELIAKSYSAAVREYVRAWKKSGWSDLLR